MYNYTNDEDRIRNSPFERAPINRIVGKGYNLYIFKYRDTMIKVIVNKINKTIGIYDMMDNQLLRYSNLSDRKISEIMVQFNGTKRGD